MTNHSGASNIEMQLARNYYPPMPESELDTAKEAASDRLIHGLAAVLGVSIDEIWVEFTNTDRKEEIKAELERIEGELAGGQNA
jgi:hypothetical protein